METTEKSKKRRLVERIIESDLKNGRKIENKCRFFLKRFLRQDEIDDVMQDSYLKAVQFAEEYDEKRPFIPWFLGIVKNTRIDFFRKIQAKKEINETSVTNPDYGDIYKKRGSACTEETNPELILLKNERDRLVRKIVFEDLRLANNDYFNVIFRYYWSGQEYNEIAIFEDIPLGTVKTRLHAAKRDLKKLIEDKLGSYLLDD